MALKTMTTEDARLKFRDVLDDVIAGDEVVIERYRKPTAAVISIARFERLRQYERERHAHLAFQIHDEMTADPAKDLA